MRSEEEFVLKALVKEFGGHFTEGDHPNTSPDAYLYLEKGKTAVEVTRLIEPVTDEHGVVRSRETQDAPARNFAEAVDSAMKKNIPDGLHVLLVIPTPLNNVRKTKTLVEATIVNMLEEKVFEKEDFYCGNRISISIYEGERSSGKKVISAIAARYSDANMVNNTKQMLTDRIMAKNKKCNFDNPADMYWLALFNNYWIADAKSYQYAYDILELDHKFDQIHIVNEYSVVHRLY